MTGSATDSTMGEESNPVAVGKLDDHSTGSEMAASGHAASVGCSITGPTDSIKGATDSITGPTVSITGPTDSRTGPTDSTTGPTDSTAVGRSGATRAIRSGVRRIGGS